MRYVLCKQSSKCCERILKLLRVQMVAKFCIGNKQASAALSETIQNIERVLLPGLYSMTLEDSEAVKETINLLGQAANHIDVGSGGMAQRLHRTEFALRISAGQAASVWPEFLFGYVRMRFFTLDGEDCVVQVFVRPWFAGPYSLLKVKTIFCD